MLTTLFSTLEGTGPFSTLLHRLQGDLLPTRGDVTWDGSIQLLEHNFLFDVCLLARRELPRQICSCRTTISMGN